MNLTADSNNSSMCTFATSLHPAFEHLKALLYCVIIILSITGNFCVLFVIYKNRPMQTVTNYLICNSSLADLLITCIPNVLEVVDLLKHHGRWPLGLFMCKFFYLSVYLSVGASILTLEVITIERYLAVVHPHKRYLEKKQLKLLIPAIWTVAFLFACPTLWAQKVVYEPGFGNACVERWTYPFNSKQSPKHYTVVLFLCLYAIPLLSMSVLYSILGKKLWQSPFKKESVTKETADAVTVYNNQHVADSRVCKTDDNLNGIADVGGEVGSPTHLVSNVSSGPESSVAVAYAGKPLSPEARVKIYTRTNSRSGDSRKRRVVKMLAALVIVFALCWMPVFAYQFVLFFHPYFIQCPESLPLWIGFFAFAMQYSNSAINPFLYFIFSRTYRKGLKSAFYTGAKQRKVFSGMESRTQ